MRKYLSFGAGVNSTALMLLLIDEDIEFESVFSDTGCENPETYEYLEYLQKRGYEITRIIPQVKGQGENKGVIYSPPYGNRLADDVVQDGDKARMSYRQAVSIVTSPPYEGTISGEGGGSLGQEESQSLKTMREYSEDPENIGNLKTNSYLEAMLQVYRECFKVGGKLILVTKNFIRNMQVVRLDLDTIRLCEAAGFHLSDHWYFKLPTKSFWKIIYSQKYPDVPEVEYEDILIFTKEAGG